MNLSEIKKWGLVRKLAGMQDAYNAGTPAEQSAFRASMSMAVPKTIVILGSSNAAGWGAGNVLGVNPSAGNGWASPATSWAGLLTSALGASWSVINRSIGGTNTQDSINRFYTDVAPHRPSFVILATGFANEPGSNGSKAQCNAAAEKYLRNIGTLISMCQSINAQVVCCTGTVRNDLNGDSYAALLSTVLGLQQYGVPVIDFISCMDDGNGHFISQSGQIDGAHVNDTGHSEYFHQFEPSVLTSPGPAYPGSGVGGAITVAPGNSYDGPQIEINLEYPLTSFCMSASIRGATSGVSAAKAFMGAYAFTDANKTVRVRNPNSVYELVSDSNLVAQSSVNPTADAGAHEVSIRYVALSDTLSLHIDGIPIGSSANIGASRAATISRLFFAGATLSGGAVGYAFSNLSLWRSPLSAGALYIRQITGVKPKQSLILDCAAPYISGVLPDRAPGSVAAVLNGAFTFA